MDSVQRVCDKMFSLDNIDILFTSIFLLPKNNALLKVCWKKNTMNFIYKRRSLVPRVPCYIVHSFNFNQKEKVRIFLDAYEH